MKAIILLLALAAVSYGGTVFAWGGNEYGQGSVPPEVAGADIIALGLGSSSDHNLVMTDGGDLLAWGKEENGQCIVPEFSVDFGTSFSTYQYLSLSVMNNGEVEVWGQSSGSYSDYPSPYVSVSGGWSSWVGLRQSGVVTVNGSSSGVPEILTDSTSADVASVAAGRLHFLALRGDSTIVAWGNSTYGQCDVPDSGPFVAVSGGGLFSVAIRESNGSIEVWGYGSAGLMASIPSPNSGFIAVSAGDDFIVAQRSDSTLVAWGNNDHGQCNIPPALAGVPVTAFAAGSGHVIALVAEELGIDPSEPSAGQGQLSLSAFPNPSNGYLEFSLSGGGEVDVYDVSGRIVSSVSIPQSGNVSFTAPATGVYFASVRGSDTPATRFVIVR